MHTRLTYHEVSPGIVSNLRAVEGFVHESGLDHNLLELVKLRASQINGCAYCLNLHANHLRERGETNARLDLLAGWRESPVYSDQERAAFAWTEAVTRLEHGGVPDAVYEAALEQFGDVGLANLTLAIAQINVWNRLNVAFQQPPAL